jgi:hypothetical protein
MNVTEHRRQRVTAPITLDMGKGVSLRAYPDSRPHVLETAELQKGLVLLKDGRELIEEGVGFGSPVAVYSDGPHLSRMAGCLVGDSEDGRVVITKSFVMNAVPRKRLGNGSFINPTLDKMVEKTFMGAYTRWISLRPILDAAIYGSWALGAKTQYVKTKSVGVINVNYTILTDGVRVDADLNELNKNGLRTVMMLNEQGASFFRKYLDNRGLTLEDEKIGAWAEVVAEEATISDLSGELGFSLWKIEGTKMFRGRDKRGTVSWAGLEYSIGKGPICYDIKVKAR